MKKTNPTRMLERILIDGMRTNVINLYLDFMRTALELVGPNYRSFVTVMTCTFYTMGLCMLAGVTYLIRDWRTLTIVTSAPFLLYILYWW